MYEMNCQSTSVDDEILIYFEAHSVYDNRSTDEIDPNIMLVLIISSFDA